MRHHFRSNVYTQPPYANITRFVVASLCRLVWSTLRITRLSPTDWWSFLPACSSFFRLLHHHLPFSHFILPIFTSVSFTSFPHPLAHFYRHYLLIPLQFFRCLFRFSLMHNDSFSFHIAISLISFPPPPCSSALSYRDCKAIVTSARLGRLIVAYAQWGTRNLFQLEQRSGIERK